MIEEIALSLYRVEVPLPHNPLKSINSYFIKAREHNLIIDTGMNLPECKQALSSAVTKLEIDLNQTDFYITHLHVDHLELASYLATRTSKIYLNKTEAAILSHPISWEVYRSFCLNCGFPEDEMKKMEQNTMTQGFRSGQFRLDFVGLHENDFLKIGDYSFNCVETPGHSPGHMCLYEPDKKILVSGDHVLFDITPNITSWPSMENALGEYLKNLDKIYPLNVTLVLPGHRSIENNHRKRILELKEHHCTRVAEVLSALGEEVKTAYQIAPMVTWEVSYKSWEQFPTPQKFFAMGEVMAHLRYLEGEGTIHSGFKHGRIFFSRHHIND
jgi:glyoxylase-like metal-dependent hydrolase (beta-lactamase superfamily II)